MTTKIMSSSAKKSNNNVRRPKTSIKSSTKQQGRFASAKKSSTISPQQPPTPVASANVNKNFRQSLRPTPKGVKKSSQSTKQTKSLIKPLNSRKRSATATAKKAVSKTRSTTSKTLARSKTAKNLQQKNVRKSPKSPAQIKTAEKVSEKSKPKTTTSKQKTSVRNTRSARGSTSPRHKPSVTNSTKQFTVHATDAKKPTSPKKTVVTKPKSPVKKPVSNKNIKPRSPRSPTKAASPTKGKTAPLPPKSPRNLKSPRNISKRAANRKPVTQPQKKKTEERNKSIAKQNTTKDATVASGAIAQAIQKTEANMESKSSQFKKKLEIFEQELLKAKTDYDTHVKRVAFQKTVWQKKYFNLLRIKSNDPVLNELAKERKNQLLAKKQAQRAVEAAKNGIKILSPIHELEANSVSKITQSQSTGTVSVQTDDKQLQTVLELKDMEVNTENLETESNSHDDNDETLNEMRDINEKLSNKLKKQRNSIISSTAAMIDEYNCLRKDVSSMKTEMKNVWQTWKSSLTSMLISELNGLTFVSKKSTEVKQTETAIISTHSIHVQTEFGENNDITPLTTIFMSETPTHKVKFVDAETMAEFTGENFECWEIGTQTELTEVDSQSMQLQALVNDLNQDLISIDHGSIHSVNHTPINNKNNSTINATVTVDNSINTQQWFDELANKMSQIHVFKKDIHSIKDQVSLMVTQSKIDFNHLFTTIHAIGRYNQNMKQVVESLRNKNEFLQHSPNATAKKLNKTSINAENLTVDQRREKDLQYMTNNVDSTLQQIRNLYQATNTIDNNDHIDEAKISPLVSNHTFFACDHDFNNNELDKENFHNGNQLYNYNAAPEIFSTSETESIDLPPQAHVETELDKLSENLPVSKEFLSFYIEKQNSNSSPSKSFESQFSQWNSLVVNTSRSVRSDECKQEETGSQSLESNIDLYVENATKHNLDSVTSEMEPTTEIYDNIDKNNLYKTDQLNESTNQQYKGKLQLLQKKIRTKQVRSLSVETDNIDESIARPDTPISIKSTSKSISDDMVIELEQNEATIEELFEESLMSDRALLRKIDSLDTILDGLLSVA